MDSLKEQFEKKFVVTTGTKKIKRVGFWLQPNSEFPTAHGFNDVWSWIETVYRPQIEEGVRKEMVEKISLDIEQHLESSETNEFAEFWDSVDSWFANAVNYLELLSPSKEDNG